MSGWDPFWRTAIRELAEVGRDAVRQGLVVATGGNLSVRGSARHGAADQFVITARGSRLDRLHPGTFVVMATTATEATVRYRPASGIEASSEWRLHARTYQARPDVAAIVHLHPAHCVLLDALGRPLRLLTLDHVAYVGRTARIPFHPNGSEELADAAAQAAGEADCVVLAHHGCSALGRTLAEAYRRAVNLESAATATYRMLLLGDEHTEFPPGHRATALHQG